MAMKTDPVCGMQVDDQNSPVKSQYQGKDFYFCAKDCKKKFDLKPEQYAEAKATQGKQAQASSAKR